MRTQIWRMFFAISGGKNYNTHNATVWASPLLSDPTTLDSGFNVPIIWYSEMVIKDSEMSDQQQRVGFLKIVFLYWISTN